MVNCTLSPDEVKRLKGLGFLRDKNTPDAFNVRVVTRAGRLSAKQLSVLAEAAERFGIGEVALTTRLSVELRAIPGARADELIAYLADYDLSVGGTGPRVRPIVSCKGTSCSFGIIDTWHLADRLHDRFYLGYHSVTLPHKFKIAVGGCPNNCAKPDLNDVGIIGRCEVKANAELCRGCGVCAAARVCGVGAISTADGRVSVSDACIGCGKCHGSCPFGVFAEKRSGYSIRVGGTWGKTGARGILLPILCESEDEVLDVVEGLILLYRAEGAQGERLRRTIERLGVDCVTRALLEKTYLAKKDEILA